LLRYCQTSLKALKASGRVPELEALKQSFFSLEERIRTHQQVFSLFFFIPDHFSLFINGQFAALGWICNKSGPWKDCWEDFHLT
jgi:hypothetical protein